MLNEKINYLNAPHKYFSPHCAIFVEFDIVKRFSRPGKSLQNLARMFVLDRLEFSTFARSSLSFRLCRRFVRVRLGIGIALWVIRLQSRVLVKVFVLTQVLPEAAILENKIEYSKCLKSECSDFGAL